MWGTQIFSTFRKYLDLDLGRSVDMRPIMEKPTMTNNLSYSDKGLALTKQFEGLRLTAYQDSIGVWTIGYGHTGSEVHRNLTITEHHACRPAEERCRQSQRRREQAGALP